MFAKHLSGPLDKPDPSSNAAEQDKAEKTAGLTDYRTGGPARFYNIAETGRRLGFIIDRRHDRPAVARHMSVTGG